MRFKPNSDKSVFTAYKGEGKKLKKIAVIEINLLDIRRQGFGKGKYCVTGCFVSVQEEQTDEDLQEVYSMIPYLKRQRLNYVLKHLDRFLLEAQMSITGRTTEPKYFSETIPINDIKPDDLRQYAATIKHRATILGNDLMKKAADARKTGKKRLKVCHTYIQDGFDEYSDDTWARFDIHHRLKKTRIPCEVLGFTKKVPAVDGSRAVADTLSVHYTGDPLLSCAVGAARPFFFTLSAPTTSAFSSYPHCKQ